MENLYSYKRAYPYAMPLDQENYDINDFVLAPEKPAIPTGKFLEWTGDDWVVREPYDAEVAIKWEAIRQQRNMLLQESDVLLIRSFEDTNNVSQELKDYRQLLRDITLQTDPWNIVWPIKP